MMYYTFEHARVICKECNKEVQRLMPGTPFEGLKTCDCQVKEEVKDAKRGKTTKEV